MFLKEAALLKDLETLAREYDKAAKVIVYKGAKAGAQVVHDVTFAILVEPNNSELRQALVDFGMSKDNEVELTGFQVDLQQTVLTDVLFVEAKIYYKG